VLQAMTHLPLALGGDSLTSDNSAIAVISLLSIVAGYALLAGLWYFVFRQNPKDKEAERRAAERRGSSPPAPPTDSRPRASPSASTTSPGRHAASDDGARLAQRRGPRFRRR
jgi:hypothetical protein